MRAPRLRGRFEGLEPRRVLNVDFGDLNDDGQLDVGDADFLSIAVRDGLYLRRLDLNQDDSVDVADIDTLVQGLVHTKPGDVNLDGVVSFDDFLRFSQHFGANRATWSMGDFDANGVVGFSDFLKLSENFGFQSTFVRYVRLVADSEVEGDPWAAIAELGVVDSQGASLEKDLWSIAYVNSEELVAEFAPAEFAIDGDPQTFWHTEWAPEGTENDPAHPHELVVDLGGFFDVGGVVYTPRQDINNGRIVDFRLFQSRSANQWSAPTASGVFLEALRPQVIRNTGVELANAPPTLAEIPDQHLEAGVDRWTIPLGGFDEDGDPLSYVAAAYVQNPLAEIRDTYGLRYIGDYYENLTGFQEKWLQGAAGTSYVLLPQGDLLEWQGSLDETATRESLIARLDSSIYEDPSLLWDAPPELPAPAVVTIEDDQLTVDPAEAAFGDIRVRVSVTDGKDVVSQSFSLSMDESPARAWTERIAELLRASESLEHAAIPAFLQQLVEFEADLAGRPAAEVSDLIRKLQKVYADGEIQIQAAEAWEAEEKRLLEQQRATVEHIQQELGVLQAEYDAAWTSISQRLDEDSEAEDTGPPIFVLGTDIGPLEIGIGDTLELDLSAIHPTQIVRYYFAEDVDLDGLGTILYHPQTGQFRWSVPSHALGSHTFTVVAEVGDNNTAQISFQVNVVSNDPTIGALSARPSTITDRGTDLVTLTAQGVQHPSGHVDKVEFWLDADGDGAFDPDRYGEPRNDQEFYGEFIKGNDRLLGVDADGANGWTWSGLLPNLSPGTQMVFARSSYSTQAADTYSLPTSVSIQVLETPKFDILEETSAIQEITSSYRAVGETHINQIVLPPFDTSLGTLTHANVVVVPQAAVTDAEYGFADANHDIAIDVGPFDFSGIAQRMFLPGTTFFTHNHIFHIVPDTRSFRGEELLAFESGTQSWDATNLETRDAVGHRHALPVVAFQAFVDFEYKPIETMLTYDEGRSIDVFYRGNSLYAQWYDNGTPAERVRLAADAQADNAWVRYGADQDGDVVVVYNKGSYTQEDVFLVAASRNGTIHRGPEQLNSRNTGWYKNPAFAMNSQGEGVVAWNDQDWSEFNAGNRTDPTITVMRTFSATGNVLGEEVEFLEHDGFADLPLAAAINETGDFLVGWAGYYTQNNVHTPREPVASSSAGVIRNVALAMHSSQWAVTPRGSFGKTTLQALDPNGSPVGNPFDIGLEDGRLDRIDLKDDGEVVIWWRQDGANTTEGRRATTYHRQRLQLDLQTNLTPQSLSIIDPRNLTAGQAFDVEFTIRNEGLLNATPFEIGFYLSQDETLSTSDRLLGTIAVETLLADRVSDPLSATLTMPENADPFWNEGTTGLRLILSIAGGGGTQTTTVPFVTTERSDEGTGGNGGTGGPDDPDPVDTGAPYIRPGIALEQLGNHRIKVTYDAMELIGRQMVATLRSFARKAMDVDARSLADELHAKANRIELGLDTYFDQKWEMAQAREEAERKAQEALAAATAAAETKRLEEETAERNRRQQTIDGIRMQVEREREERDQRIDAAKTARDEAVDDHIAEYNDAIDVYNDIVDGGVDAFKKIVGFFRDPLKAFRDALATAEDAIDWAEEKIESAKQTFLDVRAGILKEFDFIVAPFQQVIDSLPTLEDIKDGALATRDHLVKKAEATYATAVAALDEEFGDDIDRIQKNAAPILKNPGLAAVVDGIQNPGGALEELNQKLANLPAANPIGSPADLKKTLTEGTQAIVQGRLGDVVSQVLPPEAVQAAGDFADWAKDVGGKSTDWVKDKGEVVAEWAKDGAANAEEWLLEKKDHVAGFEWNPFKPHPRQALTMIDWLKLDHGYNTNQATIVFDLVFAKEPGLTGEFLAEFEQQFAQSTEEIYRAWFAHAESQRGELSVDAIFGGAQRLAMIRFLAKYELNPDGSPAVTYIDDDTTWAEYAEEHADDPPPRRRGFRKPEWVTQVQGVLSLTQQEEEFCAGCEVDYDGTITDPDGLPVGWVDADLVVAISKDTGNQTPTWGSDGTTIVDEDTGTVIGSFYTPDDQPSTYHDFDEIHIGGEAEDPIVIKPVPRPNDDDNDDNDGPEQWSPSSDPSVQNRRIEISNKFAPNLQKNAKASSDRVLADPNVPVRSFYDDLDQVLANTESFLNGFGDGVSESIDGLAASAAALLKSDTWISFADSIADAGSILGHDFTQFIDSNDKLEFVKQYGSDWQDFVNHSVETVAVKVLTEWYQASPEERWGIAGKITGIVATEMTVEVVGGGVLKKLGGAAVDLAKKPSKVVDDILDSPEFKELDDHFSVSKRTPIDGQLIWAGMDPQHARQLWQFAKDKEMMFIVRGANQNALKWHNRAGYAPKAVDLKLNTDPKTGLVKASRTPDGKLLDARGDLKESLTVDDAGRIIDTEKGPTRYRLDDDGFVVDDAGNKFFSDYDLMGGYENTPGTDRWAQVSLGVGDAQGGTGTLREMNEAVGGRNLEMFQHGGNDEYWESIGEVAKPGKTDVGETFIIVDPVQGVRVVDLAELYQLYKERGIPWPLE